VASLTARGFVSRRRGARRDASAAG
jgi:hypothetical protein